MVCLIIYYLCSLTRTQHLRRMKSCILTKNQVRNRSLLLEPSSPMQPANYCFNRASWGCRICQLHFEKPLPSQRVFLIWLETIDCEVSVLELWGMWSTPSLPLFCHGLEVPVRVPSISQIELFNHQCECEYTADVKLNSQYYIILETNSMCAN